MRARRQSPFRGHDGPTFGPRKKPGPPRVEDYERAEADQERSAQRTEREERERRVGRRLRRRLEDRGIRTRDAGFGWPEDPAE